VVLGFVGVDHVWRGDRAANQAHGTVARFDILDAVLYISGSFFTGLSIVRDWVFVSLFAVLFGTLTAFANWSSLKNRASLRR